MSIHETGLDNDLFAQSRVDAFLQSSGVRNGGEKFSQGLSQDYLNLQALMDAHVDRINAAAQKSPLSFNAAEKHTELLKLIAAHKGDLSPKVHQVCQKLMRDGDTKARRIEASARTPDEIALGKKLLYGSVEEALGKLLFLGGRKPKETLETLKSDPKPTQAIHSQFDSEIQAMLSRLQTLWQADKDTGVQDPDLARSMRLPVEMAKMLLNSNGQINTALIAPLKNTLFPAGTSLLQYEQIMLKVLNSMDASWQPLLDAIHKPTDPTSLSNNLIYGDLGLSTKSTLQDIHAKQAVLAALLTQHCQGPVGDCFAMAFSIKLHDEFLKNALQQYGQLVQEGSLQRPVNGSSDRFFFIASIADDDLQKSVTVDADGHLNQGPFLWQCPSLASAFRQMGLDNPQHRATGAIPLLMSGSDGSPIQTTPDAIIAAFAKASLSSYPKRTLDEQIANGRYGFSATNNRMLRAFETALASMAEARTGDYVHDDMVDAVQTTLKDTWSAAAKELPRESRAVAAKMQQLFQQTLIDNIRYLYDSAISCAGVSSDGSSTAGGFELYQRDLTNEMVVGTRIATPGDFQKMILNVVDLTAKAQLASSPNDSAAIQKTADAVSQFVKQTAFMQKVLVAYEPSNANDPNPVANYAKLTRTPMTSQDGDNPWEVDQIDTGLSFNPNIQAVQPQNCTELLKWVLDLASWKEKTQHYLESADPDALDPVTSPEHAFNLSIDDQEIVAFLKSGLSSDQWISQRFAESSKVANWTVDATTQQSVVDALTQQLTQVSTDVSNQFQQWASNSLSSGMPLSQFAASLVQEVQALLNANSDQAVQIALMVDQLLFQTLPDSVMQQIEQKAVRFANTNWNDGVKEIYFCMYSNPRTQSITFGTIDEDRTNLAPMDETQWVDNQQWNADVTNEPANMGA